MTSTLTTLSLFLAVLVAFRSPGRIVVSSDRVVESSTVARPVRAPKFARAAAQPITLRATSRGANAAETPFQLGVARLSKNGVNFYDKSGGGGGGRGFNIAALNAVTGDLLQPVQNFDTYFTRVDGSAVNAMVSFLNSIPSGALILIAVADETGLNRDNSCAHFSFPWTESALQSLEKIGSRQIRNYCFRYSFAMAAIKGAGVALDEQLASNAEAAVQVALSDTLPCPSSNDISPAFGKVGDGISILGSGFTGVNAVQFSNGVSASFTVISDKQIDAVVPTGAQSGPVSVRKLNCDDARTRNFALVPSDSLGPGPSEVSVSGRQLIVRRRSQDGTLGASAPYQIAGMNWSPAGPDTQTTPFDPNNANVRRPEFSKWAPRDIPLLKEMQVNTVRVYIDPGVDAAGRAVLDQLYRNGIMVIMTVDDAVNDMSRVRQVVSFYKDHPAILMWMIGSEWNINRYFGAAVSVQDAARKTETAAALIKSLDSKHPVSTSYGEIDIDADGLRLLDTRNYVNAVCPSVDAWALNIYRGNTFGNLFNQWQALSSKPMFIGEFGTDAFQSFITTNPAIGAIDEFAQSKWDISLWNDLAANLSAKISSNVALGGLVFEFNDEFWKVPPPDSQQADGFVLPGGHPDNFGNEEYFGVVDINRARRLVFGTLASAFSAIRQFGPEISDATLQGSKKVVIQGNRFGTAPHVLINGVDRSDFIISNSDVMIVIKGKQKKLGLVTGDNPVQVINSDGASNVFKLRV